MICSGDSERQVKSIAEHIEAMLSGERHSPMHIEGAATAQWILMDFGDVVTHVFRSDVREHYALEKLWHDARSIRVPTEPPSPAVAPPRATGPRTVRVRRQ